ncbi:hypothetical protein [Silvimonas sp.]|uniref:hypothetical protein n=1 Tax=Silvimonas sp. TaxID=2650811 RepID=UPI0028470ED6|nr:hypothetical protein [Silvimonas sp.]MDR3428998.1 hypothetical protein [Silvimonas sp.]
MQTVSRPRRRSPNRISCGKRVNMVLMQVEHTTLNTTADQLGCLPTTTARIATVLGLKQLQDMSAQQVSQVVDRFCSAQDHNVASHATLATV